jgi:hypothetical protein
VLNRRKLKNLRLIPSQLQDLELSDKKQWQPEEEVDQEEEEEGLVDLSRLIIIIKYILTYIINIL